MTNPTTENLTQRLERAANTARVRQAGDRMEAGGWVSRETRRFLEEPPQRPSRALLFGPYVVLFIVAVALTIGLILIGGQS